MVRTRFDIFCTYVLSFSVKFFLRFFYIFLRRNSVGKVGGGCAFPGVATDVIPAVSQKQIRLIDIRGLDVRGLDVRGSV